MARYTYELYTAVFDVDSFGNTKITGKEFWVERSSLAEVGLLVNLTPGQVSYIIRHGGEHGWHGFGGQGGGGPLFRIVRKWRPRRAMDSSGAPITPPNNPTLTNT